MSGSVFHRLVVLAAVACPLALTATAADAASAAKCTQYAQAAVVQNQENVAKGCNLTGPRWQSSYQSHYDWCMAVPDAAVDAEQQARVGALAVCTQPIKGQPLRPGTLQPAQPAPVAPGQLQTTQKACADYGSAAVAQQNENAKLGCGFTGALWSADYNTHVSWCLTAAGGQAVAQSKARQAQLQTCQREKSCAAYAGTAVAQNSKNLAEQCGFTGPRWTSDPAVHHDWCLIGQNLAQSASETKARDNQLVLCAANKPLDGTFKVGKVTPQIGPGGYVQTIDIAIEATSTTPWTIGDYGHPQNGSLWAEVTAINKVWQNGLVQDKKQKYQFAIRGIASGKQAFMAPVAGTKVGAGTQMLVLRVSPMPRIGLTGVQRMFGVPKSGPFDPGSLRCWQDYPSLDVEVLIVTKANVDDARSGSTGDITNGTILKANK